MVSIQWTISAGKLLDIKSLHSNSTTIVPWISKEMSTRVDECRFGTSSTVGPIVCLEWLGFNQWRKRRLGTCLK